MKLVIVESPTKAKTISKFLGQDFDVRSSFGHIRDLPKSETGVDTEHDFEPKYVIPKKKQKTVTELKNKAQKAEVIYFATDEDREGEAISWHLSKIFNIPESQTKRIVFHEITKDAILHALTRPRPIDLNLVDAQQARRILDRLVGYELSPFLWKKVARGLSAGRVQSVAVRLIVEREREIKNFVPQEYWTIEAVFAKKDSKEPLSAKLHKIDGKVIDKFAIKSAIEADKILANLKEAEYTVANVERKQTKRVPSPPFTTSSLQQEAGKKLGFSAKQTMRIAQQLYEGIGLGDGERTGLITYMRTDSVFLSDRFQEETRDYIKKILGPNYIPKEPRIFKKKSKLVQEAHEAIRPTEAKRKPEALKKFLDTKQFKLYDLIWKRTIASQMTEAIIASTVADIYTSRTPRDKEYSFRAVGSIIEFDGYLMLYPDRQQENLLPPLSTNEPLDLQSINPKQHFSEPPPRYGDASLIKTLEEYGIGRPSTYAPTISTIIERGYVERVEGKKFKPQEVAFLVNDILVLHFPKIVDYKFTAEMEDDLDSIAKGEKQWVPVVRGFYNPFKENLTQKEKELSKKDVVAEETTKEICGKCGKPMAVKLSRYGKFLGCSGFPECKYTKPLEQSLNKDETESKFCSKCGAAMLLKKGRYGLFWGCSNYPDCKNVESIQKSTGLPCPSCGKGEIVQRKSKKGKIFYGCSRYPDCKFVFWQKPTGELCLKCSSPLVYGKKEKVECSNKECEDSR